MLHEVTQINPDRPVGKASPCLREAASAKAGANLLAYQHLESFCCQTSLKVNFYLPPKSPEIRHSKSWRAVCPGSFLQRQGYVALNKPPSSIKNLRKAVERAGKPL
jgi:hypothetical protein